jgi:integrase
MMMGTIYRPTYTAHDGTRKESAVWWVRYRQHGKTLRQSTETTDERKAREFLRQQEGKVALKIPINVEADRLTLDAAADMIRRDYTTNGRKSAATVEYRLAHLLAAFGGSTRLSRLTTGAVETYKTGRLKAGAKPATVNRELACLSRMATLARKQHGLAVPYIVDGLEERNVRTGFFEADAFEAVRARLRPELAALATAAQITGWRKSELRSRQWRHVDLTAGWLRLEPQETKNGEGRQFPLVPALRALLEAQQARVEAIQRKTGRVVPWVFCRDDGAPAGDFKKAWATACIRAGFFRVEPVLDATGAPVVAEDGTPVTVKKPTRIFHDFRRTAVRNLVRAGIPETVAMKMTGHRTNAVFKRYAIVDEGMLREAGEKLVAAMAAAPSRTKRQGRVTALRS